ncbi:MAG TPA: ABC transporter substrate-binding protein [Candidatus Limnocylindria bacterium]|nr:ABC transporter substrate-binding protein [Candidatus Limnocylindria bacterium]
MAGPPPSPRRPPVAPSAEDLPGGLTRRQFLGGVAGTAGLLAVGGLAACSGPGATGTAPPALTLGSNYSDDVPRRAMQAVVDRFSELTDVPVVVNTVAPQAFQDRISAYLQGTPDDVFTWFGGQRMRFFADQGLAGDVSGVWSSIAAHHTEAARQASTASDGNQYLVPFITYPWVMIYRQSVWREMGYEQPATLDELVVLAERMRADGLVPLAFGNREGWPAMGTFDILNLRLNGHDFHLALLEGREQWTDKRVRRVFETWRDLLPYHQAGALGRTWQEAARSMIAGEAGMIYLATFAGEQASEEERDDLRLFHFPLLGTPYDDELALDAPINGFMLSPRPAQPGAARAFLEFVGGPEAQGIFVAQNPNRIAVATDADTSGYTSFQRQMAQVIGEAGRLAQFFDRDTRPDFAGANGMQGLLGDFLHEPDLELGPYLQRIQDFWDSLG